MRTHQEIDLRSLALARAIVAKIDSDDTRRGLTDARATCARWYSENPSLALAEWLKILQQEWAKVRVVLLAETEDGQRLRQSNPFCGVLTAVERWSIYQRFNSEKKAA